MGEIVIVKYNDELYPQVVALRQFILRDPVKRPYTKDELEKDKYIVYFAYIDNNEILGVVGLEKLSSEKGQLRQMAVHDKIQGQGIGRKLVKFLEEYARMLKLQEINVESRYTVRGFYSRLGFNEYGTVFDQIGIRHINMKKLF